MPTDAQIEVVARAMWERDLHSGSVPYEKDIREDYRNTARVAIAAYEATRPAVATDEELLAVFNAASYASTTAAGIRAVRERLALSEPEVTANPYTSGELMRLAVKGHPLNPMRVLATYANPNNWTSIHASDDKGPRHYWSWDGPTIVGYELAGNALAAALAEAGKEASDG